MSFIDLPPEIIALIVDNFHNDHATLGRCSLVSPSFLDCCRRYLFAYITVSSADQSERLYSVFSINPNIVPKTHTLHVLDTQWAHNTASFALVLELLASCGTLEVFHYENHWPKDKRFIFPSGNSMKDLFKSPQLNRVIVDGIAPCSFSMELLVVTRSLEHFTFTGSCSSQACLRRPLFQVEKKLLSPPSVYPYLSHAGRDHTNLLMRYIWECLRSQLRTMWISISPTNIPSPINLGLFSNLTSIVFELKYFDPHTQLYDIVASGLPRSIECLALLMPCYALRHRRLGWVRERLVTMDAKLAMNVFHPGAYPRLRAVLVIMITQPDDAGVRQKGQEKDTRGTAGMFAAHAKVATAQVYGRRSRGS